MHKVVNYNYCTIVDVAKEPTFQFAGSKHLGRLPTKAQVNPYSSYLMCTWTRSLSRMALLPSSLTVLGAEEGRP